MKVNLEGFANNVIAAMGKRDTHGWGYTLKELVFYVTKLEGDNARLRIAAEAVVAAHGMSFVNEEIRKLREVLAEQKGGEAC